MPNPQVLGNTACAPIDPVSAPAGKGIHAPWPLVDRYPIQIGAGLSLTYFATAYRTAITGYRQQLVDVLDELLQKEPHGYGVIWKRILGIAGARLEISPAVKEEEPEYALAKECSDLVHKQILAIPMFRQHLAALAWATYYAISACEIYWGRTGEGGWHVERLGFVHSRRLSYPDFGSWDIFIWDQGQVRGYDTFGTSPTNSSYFGLRVKDFSYKFIVHAPQLRGDYPTREGIGIQLSEWFILKRIGARGGGGYLERFGRPWVEGIYSTTDEDKPRSASDEDIEATKLAVESLGLGSLNSFVHADSIKLDLLTPDKGGTPKLTFKEWIELCNTEISKPVLGNTLTTEVGSTGGNRALGETMKQSEVAILKYDAQAMCDSLREQLCKPIIALNYNSDVARRLTPQITLHVEEPDPMALMELASKGALSGIPVDSDRIAKEVGLPVVPMDYQQQNETEIQFRRMAPVTPGAPPDIAFAVEAPEPEPEEEVDAPDGALTPPKKEP